MLSNGIYEQLINQKIFAELSQVKKLPQITPVDDEEASRILAKYVAEVVEQGLNILKDKSNDGKSRIELVNCIISLIEDKGKTRGRFFCPARRIFHG